eukprot:m.132162 g.132162  ORF g.132162 m.132162 type:complete len:58 (-) comp14641_c0_seq2:965-1138(-)
MVDIVHGVTLDPVRQRKGVLQVSCASKYEQGYAIIQPLRVQEGLAWGEIQTLNLMTK